MSNHDKVFNRSLENISKTFEQMQEKGLTSKDFGIAGGKQNWKSTTYPDFAKICKEFLREINAKYPKVLSPDQVKQPQWNEVFKDRIAAGISAYSLRKVCHAWGALAGASKHPDINTISKFKPYDRNEPLNHLTDNNIMRRIGDSTCKKIDYETSGKIVEKIKNSKSPYAKEIYKAARMEHIFGLRECEPIKITPKNVQIDEANSKVSIINLKSKNDHIRSFSAVVTKDEMDFIKKAMEGVKDNARLVNFVDKNGKTLSDVAITRKLRSAVSTAAKQLGYNKKGDKVKISNHSLRKGFADKRYNERLAQDRKELEKELKDRINSSKYEKGKNWLIVKTQKALKRINDNRKSFDRDFTKEELARLLTSLDLGHQRMDVMSYYVNLKIDKTEEHIPLEPSKY